MKRYDRQQRVQNPIPGFDERWSRLRVLLVGMGGIGTPLAQWLVRSGVGHLKLLDGDCVSSTDLHRQFLYHESDAAAGTPKSEAALRELERIGGRTTIESVPAMLTARNASQLIGDGIDVVLDGTDHLSVRHRIDRECLQLGVPWVHGAAVADHWTVIAFLPVGRPCFHCFLPQLPPQDHLETCETAGVLTATTVAVSSAMFSLLTAWVSGREICAPGTREVVLGRVGEGERRVILRPDPGCPLCGDGEDSAGEEKVLRKLCGQGGVEAWLDIDIQEARSRLEARAKPGERIVETGSGIRLETGSQRLHLFSDGRALLVPVETIERAREQLEEWLGTDSLAVAG